MGAVETPDVPAMAIAQAQTVAPAPAAPLAPAASVLPPPALLAPVPVPPATFAPAPLAPAPAAVATGASPTWPCTACGTRVDFAETTCPNCTTPFMGGASPDISLKVPGVGDLVHMSSGMKFGVMAGGAATLAGVLVLLFLILGHIF
jgi:hypothetical protein